MQNVDEVKIDELFVATVVHEKREVIENYVQYETEGKEKHYIIVSNNKKLIYSKTNETGEVKFFDCETDEEVKEFSPNCSFESKNDYDMRYNKTKLGYFVPFSDYMESSLYGYFINKLNYIKPESAVKMLKHASVKEKPFELSFDPSTARKQLESIGYISKETVYASGRKMS